MVTTATSDYPEGFLLFLFLLIVIILALLWNDRSGRGSASSSSGSSGSSKGSDSSSRDRDRDRDKDRGGDTTSKPEPTPEPKRPQRPKEIPEIPDVPGTGGGGQPSIEFRPTIENSTDLNMSSGLQEELSELRQTISQLSNDQNQFDQLDQAIRDIAGAINNLDLDSNGNQQILNELNSINQQLQNLDGLDSSDISQIENAFRNVLTDVVQNDLTHVIENSVGQAIDDNLDLDDIESSLTNLDQDSTRIISHLNQIKTQLQNNQGIDPQPILSKIDQLINEVGSNAQVSQNMLNDIKNELDSIDAHSGVQGQTKALDQVIAQYNSGSMSKDDREIFKQILGELEEIKKQKGSVDPNMLAWLSKIIERQGMNQRMMMQFFTTMAHVGDPSDLNNDREVTNMVNNPHTRLENAIGNDVQDLDKDLHKEVSSLKKAKDEIHDLEEDHIKEYKMDEKLEQELDALITDINRVRKIQSHIKTKANALDKGKISVENFGQEFNHDRKDLHTAMNKLTEDMDDLVRTLKEEQEVEQEDQKLFQAFNNLIQEIKNQEGHMEEVVGHMDQLEAQING